MEDQYEAFCLTDSLCYDALHSKRTAGNTFDEWQCQEKNDWLDFGLRTSRLPAANTAFNRAGLEN